MNKLVIALSIALISFMATAQNSINGYVFSRGTDDPLEQAHVQILDLNKGVYTDSSGFFTLMDVPSGEWKLVVSHVSHYTQEVSVGTPASENVRIRLRSSQYELQAVDVISLRADEDAPITSTNVTKTEIEERNLGQDIPMLLDMTPSVVSSSDAGAGIGYTNMRIRGSDQTRINVTINGIAYNDPESQGVFWVNLPDIASSANEIQIQRGVGTSTNGAGAFGATVNVQTTDFNADPYAGIRLGAGSFNTFRTNASFGTGLLKNRWILEGRMSYIHSDGYIDRARSDLKSYYLSAGYYGEKTTLKMIHFAGREETYQSWYGTPQSRLDNDTAAMLEHASNEGYDSTQIENLLSSGRTYNHYLYDNEVDNYGQDHYQFHVRHDFNSNWTAKGALHYTRGKGYFEQYRDDEDFADYGLSDLVIGSDTISTTDLIRRRWLDNHFVGGTYELSYTKANWEIQYGGAYNTYLGDHFGEIIWSEYANGTDIRDNYYFGESTKNDFNNYLKITRRSDNWLLFADMQFRNVRYTAEGTDNDLVEYVIDENFNFFNPKAGVTYFLSEYSNVYASFAVANREPVRSDFIDAPEGEKPVHETLYDTEVGYRISKSKWQLEVNGYYMDYNNQLVLTGELNDVGASVRRNIEESYRAGIEISGGLRLTSKLQLSGSIALSRNVLPEFEEVLYDYTNGFDVIRNTYTNTPIALSPDIVSNAQLQYKIFEGFEATWLARFVGRQYLDNTGNEARSIDPFVVNDLRLDFRPEISGAKNFRLSLLVNNILNAEYSAFGYTYSYIFGETITENFYYPQATRNFMVQLAVDF